MQESAVQRIKTVLADHPSVVVEQTVDGLRIPGSKGGFDVAISEGVAEQTVSAGLWHEHFENSADAADCFLWLLTPCVRIVESRRNGSAVTARMERNESGGWVEYSRTGVLFKNPFARTEEVVLQNTHIQREPPSGDEDRLGQ